MITPTSSSSSWRGTVAQILSALMWVSDFSGYAPIGTILHDPHTAEAITTFIASGMTLWGIAEHLIAVVSPAKSIKS